METILAIVVVAAVICFGALLSMGNERQRKAIDALREQTILWAIQDLRIKREMLARDVDVDDPVNWFSKIASRALAVNLDLQFSEFFDDPQALVWDTTNGVYRIIFTPIHPKEIRRISRERHGKLSQYVNRNPLLFLQRGTSIYELSVLNNGILFDLELSLAWKSLTDCTMEHTEHLWMYVISK